MLAKVRKALRRLPELKHFFSYPGVSLIVMGVLMLCLGIFLVNMLPSTIAGVIIGSATSVLALGIDRVIDFRKSTATLSLRGLDLEIFRNRSVDRGGGKVETGYDIYRASALVYNEGAVIIKDAKAVVKLKDLDINALKKMLVSKSNGGCRVNCPVPVDCGPPERSRTYLVNADSPRIEGDLLPWACPEKPVPRPRSADYTHMTSISPHQASRLLLFEFIPIPAEEGRYLVRIFSEYGAPGPSDEYPRHFRACLIMGEEDVLKLKVTVAGEGLRKPCEFLVEVHGRVLSEIHKLLENNKVSDALERLQQLSRTTPT